ncbi:hypothetical protein PSAC2689_100139 [Paraburkholderia sacchari]
MPGDASEPLFAAAAILSGDSTDPGCHLPAIFELPRIDNSCDSGRCGQGAYAAHLHATLRLFIVDGVFSDLFVEPCDFLIQYLALRPAPYQRLARSTCKFVATVLETVDDVLL